MSGFRLVLMIQTTILKKFQLYSPTERSYKMHKTSDILGASEVLN